MEYPQHVTIIMDGNGRWAKKRGKMRLFGHNNGVESVRASLEYACEHGIKYLSLFAFSEENWERPKEEVDGLMNLMLKYIIGETDNMMKNNVVFRVIGDRSRLSDQVVKAVEGLEAKTRSNDGTNLVLLLSYSGKWDLVQAARRYAQQCLDEGRLIDKSETEFSEYLSTAGIPDPDLMIRTSGEQRISNYMLWQCAYSEFYFTPVLWPDFRKADFEEAIAVYNTRQRRFGKVEQ